MRLFIPIILIVAAIGLFVVYTNPTYQATKALSVKEASLDGVLTQSQELRSLRDQLLSKRNTFSATDVQRLGEILPDNVDKIRLIIDVGNIASRHGLTLSDVQIGDIGGSAATPLAAGSANGPVGSVEVGFSINTSYDGMMAFLEDLEHSLRIIDVEKLAFTSGATGSDTYTFTIRTYWLNSQ